jgi:acetylornithine deacetylase/succinyl-diaminopimelate desuccinylase-like protein
MKSRAAGAVALLWSCGACGAGLACGGEPAPPNVPGATTAMPGPAAPASASGPSGPSTVGSPAGAKLTFEAEARALHEQLVAVDTSHGGETTALRPILERLKREGIAAEIVESAPGRGNLVARLKGDGTKKPLLLLAHIDVVPVEGQPWTVPAFPATEKDGFLWGRGVADDKAMAAAFTAVVLDLARQKTPLTRDVILALTAGEETGGFAGVQWLLQKRPELIAAEVALNEGGGLVTTPDFGDVQLVGIGVAEKQYQSYRIIARGGGGHSSAPKPGEDPALALARAVVKIGELRFPARVLPEVRASFAAAASWEKPPLDAALRHAAQTAPKLGPEDEKIITADRAYGSLVHTTCVTTMLQGSPQDNVLPTTAEAVVNCRIMPDETRAQTLATIVKTIGDAKLEVKAEADDGVGPPSPIQGEVPAAIEKVAHAMFPRAAVAASMSTGATDSRFLRGAGVLAYGVSAAPTSIDEGRAGHGAHGPDERRPVKWLGPAANYLRSIVTTIATSR